MFVVLQFSGMIYHFPYTFVWMYIAGTGTGTGTGTVTGTEIGKLFSRHPQPFLFAIAITKLPKCLVGFYG